MPKADGARHDREKFEEQLIGVRLVDAGLPIGNRQAIKRQASIATTEAYEHFNRIRDQSRRMAK